MPAASDESSPSISTFQEDTQSKSSVPDQNPPAQNNNSLNFHFSSLNNIPPWAKLLLGSAVLLAIPLFRRVLKTRNLKKTVEAAVKAADKVVEAADKVVEAAEKVAEAAEKVLGEVVEALPGGGLKEAAIKLEEFAVYVDKGAEYADSLLDSVDDVFDDVEIKLESIKIEEELQDINGEEKVVSIKIVASSVQSSLT